MKVIQVANCDKDFCELCLLLEKFQHQMLPGLEGTGYSLTDQSGITAFLLYDDKKAVGSIGIKHIDDTACEIMRVFMREEYRGKGLANLLFDHMEKYARQLGYKRAEMVTWAESKSALSLYKKLGYICSDEKASKWFTGAKYIELYKEL